MISRTFHSYICNSAHKFAIKEHLFTSGHKSPKHIHDMGVGITSTIIKSQHNILFVVKLHNLVTFFQQNEKKIK
jgi:hypothetical protein